MRAMGAAMPPGPGAMGARLKGVSGPLRPREAKFRAQVGPEGELTDGTTRAPLQELLRQEELQHQAEARKQLLNRAPLSHS